MNKNILIGIVVLLLLGGGFAVFKLSGKSVPGTSQTSQTGEQKIKNSLKGLLGLGRSVSCVVTNPDGTKGTVYVSGQKMRGDFTVKAAADKTMDTHMIGDGTYLYMWSSNSNQGTKMKMEAEQSAQTAPTPVEGQTQSMDMNQEADMDCKPWGADASLFNPPGSVTFTDISEMLNSLKPKTTPAGASSSASGGTSGSLCDQIPDPAAKAACLQGMSGQ